MTIRVILADDHRILREGLKTMLETQPDVEVIGEAENGRDARDLAGELAPDIVIMDIGMPGLNGVEATRQIVSRFPGVRVLALSMHSDKRFVSEVLRAGACGYLLKDSAFEELARALEAVARGQTYLSPAISGLVIDGFVSRSRSDSHGAADLLTPREREVLQLIAEGASTKDVANHLHISAKTASTHRQHIMGKLDMHSVSELTKYAIREGLTSL